MLRETDGGVVPGEIVRPTPAPETRDYSNERTHSATPAPSRSIAADLQRLVEIRAKEEAEHRQYLEARAEQKRRERAARRAR